jgi:hypothetical protein
MKNLRVLLPSLALAALTATGCFLVSGQFLISLHLDSPLNVTSGVSISGLEVDLRTNSTYNDHKDKIKDIADFALLGHVHNNSASSELHLDVYYFDGAETARTLAQIQAGTKVWGSLVVPANGDVDINWDQSAALFGSAGKTALLGEIKSGDGLFTLYAVSSTPTFTFTFTNGLFVAVIAAGT